MKIAIFHELHPGGALRAVEAFTHHLRKRHTVDLYTTKDSFVPKKWQGGNWKIKLYKDTIELFKLRQLHKEMAKKIDKKKYDVVFIHPSQFTQAPFVLRFLKTKKVYYCEEPLRIVYDPAMQEDLHLPFPKSIYEKAVRRLRKIIDKQNIAKADVILANSAFTQENIVPAYGLQSTVCHLGVDTKRFKPVAMGKKYDVLYIGAKDTIDGFPLLQEALVSINREVTVKIHIPRKEWIQTDKAFTELYNSTRMVLCLARNEPFGLIPLEAMSCGVPVIGINEGGYKETICDGETGFLIPRDAKKLAEHIEWLLTHPKIASEMGEEARETIVKKWDWEKRTKELEKLL